jgi:hypothetical protein
MLNPTTSAPVIASSWRRSTCLFILSALPLPVSVAQFARPKQDGINKELARIAGYSVSSNSIGGTLRDRLLGHGLQG